MVQFEEEDLFYTDYNNTIVAYPDYIAIEDLEILNLQEKYHVIYFCDSFIKRYKLDVTLCNFQKIERCLKLYRFKPYTARQLYKVVHQKLIMEHDAVS